MPNVPITAEKFLDRRRRRLAVGAADDGWIASLTKIAPLMSGVGALGSFVNGVIAARQTAEFQKQLISALQTIESQLDAIKNDLDAIYQELKDIETQIAGLGLNDKLTAIETWGSEMAALRPDDKAGAANLATAMLDARQGAANLLGCMLGLHNALVGQSIGKPLIQLLDAQGFLQIRARLLQGLHLLAFATAFNTKEQYDYGVFLRQWAANFQLQATVYLAANKDAIPLSGDLPDEQIAAGDGIVIYEKAQIFLPNVALIVDGAGQEIVLYSDTLSYTGDGEDAQMGFPSVVKDHGIAFVDVVTNQFTTDRTSPQAKECIPWVNPDRWLWVGLSSIAAYVERQKVKMVCGARFNAAQTFLGAVNGQMAWVSATDRTTYLCSIHDGDNPGGALLTFDATKGVVSTQSFADLPSLTPALWAVNWVSKGVVTIVASQPASVPPAYLSLDGSGGWTIAASPVSLNVAAASARIGPITNPFAMPPTPATLTTGAATRTVLFHQL
jgi:hypothetical protein